MRAVYQSEEDATNRGTRRLLSIDEYALLSKIRAQSQRNVYGVRTGRVSVDEIMGLHKFYDVQAFLENWRNQNRSGKRTLMPQLNSSPLIDNFAVHEPFCSLANYTDISNKRIPLPNFSAQLYSFGRGADQNNGVPLLPRNHYGLPTNYASNDLRQTGGLSTTRKEDDQQTVSRNVVSSVRTSQQVSGKRINEKKMYFSEYMGAEAVARGVAKGQLYKGTLHVNRRSFEESFLINANGDLQEDLLIFGLHDRNRALHGDVVVVRIKDRENWMVRDALFCAWREGHLRTSIDENGQPITVPPIRSLAEEEEMLDSLNLPFPIDKRDLLQKSKKISIPLCGKFTREQMLVILAKLVIDNSRCFGTKLGAMLRSDVLQKLVELCIIKPLNGCSRVVDSATSSPSSTRSATGSQHSHSKLLLHRRYYFLRDLPDEYWGIPNICLQRTAEVVFISEHKNSRAAVGMLKVMADGNRKWALFSPNDSRMPRMMIPAEETPVGFFDRPHDFAKYIYVARMVYWPATAQFARGKLYKSLGIAGDIFAETEGLLLANAVDTRSFPASVLGSLPLSEDEKWKIDEKEFKYRRDLRSEFIFAVRPMKNRVIENAVHIKSIEDCDGNGTPGYEVGVHVADVAYFVNAGTELDQWAAFRATSISLNNEVIQMLPQVLVEEICSLNAGSERLCLSVIWKMDKNASVCSKWFGRSIVRLSSEVSLEQAQAIVDQNDDSITTELRVVDEEGNNKRLTESILSLDKVATILRKRRYEEGSMQLQKTRVAFQMDETRGLPSGITVYHSAGCGWFFDEILRFANVAVAKEIQKVYGSTALLRRQCAPKSKMLNETMEKLRRIGLDLSACTEKAIASCLKNYEEDAEYKSILLRVISHFLLRPMQLPECYCAGAMKDKKDYAHFSLAVPLYAHFTSPINRYADIMTQRFLSAAVGQTPPPRLSAKEVANIAAHCNDREHIANSVSEENEDMFFGLYVKEHGPLTERAVVVQILDAAFDVLVVKYGIIKRVFANKLRIVREPRFIEGASPTLTLYWDSHENTNASLEQLIQLFSVVDVIISPVPDSVRYQVSMKQPMVGGRAPSLLDGI